MNQNVKRATETFIVAKQGASTIPVTGTLSNSSTGNVNLTEGQLGFISQSSFGTIAPLSFMDATPTITESPKIAIYQGTSASGNVGTAPATYPLWVRPFEKSNDLDGVNSKIFVTKQAFRLAANNIWTLGVISSATVGNINVLDETEYRLYIAYNSRNLDEMANGTRQNANLKVSITTPNFTDLATTYPVPIDWIVTKTGYEINKNSSTFQLSNKFRGSDPVIAIAVGLALSGPGGAAAGTAISGIAAGDSFAVFTYNGIDRTIVIDAEMLASITAAGVASGFTHLFKIVLSEAGTTTGGTATGLFLIGTDRTLAYEDRIPEKKTRLRPGMNSGFNFSTVTLREDVRADEGQGYSRPLEILYQRTAGQRKFSQLHTEDPYINFPSPVVDGVSYHVYNINHGRSEQISVGGVSFSPYREIILIPRYSTGTTTNPAIALFDTALNSWLTSSGNAVITSI